jgi:small-conductance mechanosensitive channel
VPILPDTFLARIAASAADPSPAGRALDLHLRLNRLHREAIGWLHAHLFQIAVAIVAGAAIYLALNLLRRWGAGLCRRGGAGWYDIIGRAIGRTGQLFMVLAAARLVVGYSNAPPLLETTVVTLFTVAWVLQTAVWVREIVFGVVEHRTRGETAHGHALASAIGIIRLLVTITVFAIAAVLVLGNLGVNVTGLIAGLGVGGIAIGLAAQGIFGDLFAALAILFDRPFQVGDTISYDKGAGAGTVEAIGLKSTRIRGANGEQRILANRKLLDFEILNTTRRLHNRFKFDFVLGYATPPEVILAVPALLREAVESEGHKLVHGGLNGFVANGLSYDVEFESTGSDFAADVRDRVAAAVLARFHDHAIAFACPTQVSLVTETTEPESG